MHLGAPRDVDPGVALLEEVHRSAGHVAWLERKVRALEESEMVWGQVMALHERRVGGPGGDFVLQREENRAAINVWWELYERERRHLATTAAAALKAGVEERRVRLAERAHDVLESAINRILQDLGHNPSDAAVRAIVGNRLRDAVTVIDVSSVPEPSDDRPLPVVFDDSRRAGRDRPG